jgi:hypothetical protein
VQPAPGSTVRDIRISRAVGLFLTLTVTFSSVFWLFIDLTGTPNPAYIWLVMWMPGVGALLTCRVPRRSVRTLGWSRCWSHVLIGSAVPVAYCLAVAISFPLAWLRLRSDSLWPAVFLHASHHMWMQIFWPLTTDREYTKWVAGDLGLAFVVVGRCSRGGVLVHAARCRYPCG